MMNPGKTLKYLRKGRGLRQKDICEKLFISQQNLSLMERGRVKISVEMMDEILHAMGYKLAVVEIKDKRYGRYD